MGELTQQQVDEIVETAKFLTGTTCDSDRAQALIFLFDRNRELTRQVEQLRARVDAAEKLMRDFSNGAYGISSIRRKAAEFLTALPSSSDPGRADTEITT